MRISAVRRRHALLLPALAPLLIYMASCASRLPDAPAHVNFDPPAPPQVIPVAEVKPAPPVSPVSPARVNGRIDPLPGTGGMPIRRDGDGMVASDPAPKSYVSENGDVSLNYADADVREIARSFSATS